MLLLSLLLVLLPYYAYAAVACAVASAPMASAERFVLATRRHAG